MLKTGLNFIDEEIGNLEEGVITTIYGTPGTGKSTLSFLYMISVLKDGKKVIFLDTEGSFNIERVLQIANSQNFDINLNDIIVKKIFSFDEQIEIINKLDKIINKKIGLVIVDSLVMLYRLKLGDEPRKINIKLSEQLMNLNRIARMNNFPVLVTNHLYKIFDTNKEQMVGGNIIEYWSKVIIKLSRGKDVFKLFLEKHINKKAGITLNYTICKAGFCKKRTFL